MLEARYKPLLEMVSIIHLDRPRATLKPPGALPETNEAILVG